MRSHGGRAEPLLGCAPLARSVTGVSALPYQSDPLRLLELVRPLGQAVMLHSADAAHPFGTRDIIAAGPRRIVESRTESDTARASVFIRQAGRTERSEAAPFAVLQDLLDTDAATMPANDVDAPFSGGIIGLASYDAGRALVGIETGTPSTDAPPNLWAGFYDWVIVTDHVARTTALHALPGCSPPPDLVARLSTTIRPVPRATLPPLPCEVSFDEYAAAFGRVQAYIRAGDCYQVNLAVPFSGPCGADALEVYAALAARQPAPFGAFLETDHGAVLSCSPERLLHCEDGRVRTSPIKGTIAREADPIADRRARSRLEASEKDRAENLMIVDLLRNDLGRSCAPGSIRVPQLFEVQSFAEVHHLVSTIEGHLAEGVTPLEALAHAFPGGSITGAPKRRAMEIIEELEWRRRGPYCGSVFRVDHAGRLDASITIRTLHLADGTLRCWGGGGLVADSDVEAEWREIHAKVGNLVGGDSAAI